MEQFSLNDHLLIKLHFHLFQVAIVDHYLLPPLCVICNMLEFVSSIRIFRIEIGKTTRKKDEQNYKQEKRIKRFDV